MKKTFALIVVLAIATSQLLVTQAFAADVTVTSCAQLQNLDTTVAQDADIELGQNIYCDGINFEPLDWGGPQYPFTGDFDGNNHAIYDMTISQPSENRVGLFTTTQGATLHDVKFKNADVTGSYYVGALTGVGATTTITNVHVEGEVTSDYDGAGGIVGYATGSAISLSSSDATVLGLSFIGGLAGIFTAYDDLQVQIVQSFSTGSITANNENAGGLVGTFQAESFGNTSSITIANSYSTADVVADVKNAGGIVGQALGYNGGGPTEYAVMSINNSYFSGTASSPENVGGIAGYAGTLDDVIIFSVTSVFTTGNVLGDLSVASVLGAYDGTAAPTITNTFFSPTTVESQRCIGNPPSSTPGASGCTGGGGAGPSSVPTLEENRFIENESNEPMVSWEFENNGPWYLHDNDFPSLTPDDDVDGVGSIEENDAPNAGDMDESGTRDSLEDNVASFTNKTDEYQMIKTNIGEIDSVEANFANVDDGFPWWFVNFNIQLPEPGATATIELIYTDVVNPPEEFSLYKTDNDGTEFIKVQGAVIEHSGLSIDNILRVTYSITDGGYLDSDGVANGTIVDPVGLGFTRPEAVTTVPNTVIPAAAGASGALPATGTNAMSVMHIALGIGFAGVVLSIVARKRKSLLN